MSPTMFVGRVMLPAVGLILAAALSWHLVRSHHEPGRQTFRVRGPAASVTRRRAGSRPRDGSSRIPAPRSPSGRRSSERSSIMPVREKSAVRKGDLLAELRADEVRAAVREAHQRLIEAEVGLRLEQVALRLDRIMPIGAAKQPQQQDLRRELLTAALAHRDAAKAALIVSRPSRPSTASSRRSTAS